VWDYLPTKVKKLDFFFQFTMRKMAKFANIQKKGQNFKEFVGFSPTPKSETRPTWNQHKDLPH